MDRFIPDETVYEINLNKDGQLQYIYFFGDYVKYVISYGKISYLDEFQNGKKIWNYIK